MGDNMIGTPQRAPSPSPSIEWNENLDGEPMASRRFRILRFSTLIFPNQPNYLQPSVMIIGFLRTNDGRSLGRQGEADNSIPTVACAT